METTTLGRTGLTVTRTGFGVLPLQRVEMSEAVRILRRAYHGGITFYDTARGYSDSEEKIGRALGDVRDKIVIATKNPAGNRTDFLKNAETSLRELGTDYVDLLQLHNAGPLPSPEDPESSYAGLVEAKEKGMARFIGVTCHGLGWAEAAVDSGLYDTVQFPLCHISSDRDLALIGKCANANMGVIAMKPLCGGMLSNMRPAFAFLRQFENVVPIWGIEKMHELDELLEHDANPPVLDEEMASIIGKDRAELADEFCRACGYCLPCPAKIQIPMAARMHLVIRRLPWQNFVDEYWRAEMRRIDECADCGECRSRCPYGLDPPAIMQKALREYETFLQGMR